MTQTLLPPGCYDLLPPFAKADSQLSSTLLSVFEHFGYEQVAPPLLEYSEGLLAGRGAALSAQTFRVMDPTANKVMGLRPDMTLQIARIAANSLASAPRPLRLSYNGLILRLGGDAFGGDRQLRQTGIELIGVASAKADAEVIFIAVKALKKSGIHKLTIDLNVPGIVSALLAEETLDNTQLQAVYKAVSHKDVATLARMAFTHQATLIGLIQSAGNADAALAAIAKLDLPPAVRAQCKALEEVVALLGHALSAVGDADITIDVCESRGLEYHSGLSFSIFVPGASVEVGRGGRYKINNGEEATGFTLFVDTLRGLLPVPAEKKCVTITHPLDLARIEAYHAEGTITLLDVGTKA
jgi:ATP phosphoribosyltransferase regulatory subunit